MSSRRLEDIFNVTIFRLPRRLKDRQLFTGEDQNLSKEEKDKRLKKVQKRCQHLPEEQKQKIL